MSEKVVRVVCEGPTDIPVLQQVLSALLKTSDFDFAVLQPEEDATTGHYTTAGWPRVKAWCEKNRDDLKLLAQIPRQWHVLVVQVDQDVAKDILGETPHPKTPKNVGEKIRRHIFKDWLKHAKIAPCVIVVATPAQATEAWLIAAHKNVDKSYEKNKDYLQDLEKISGLNTKNGEHLKDVATYDRLAESLPGKWGRIRDALSQAQIFSLEVEKSL